MRVRADAVRTGLRGLGQSLITLGLVLLLFVIYELEVTNLYTDQQQSQLGRELSREWAGPDPTRPVAGSGAPAAERRPATVPVADSLGRALARIYLPSLSRDYVRVVVEGVATDDLKRGPGHYPGTAAPGAVGNTVISGHRTTYGAPFNRLAELGAGDQIVLETRRSWFTYRVSELQIVEPTAIAVTYPVPGQLGATPTRHLLTLTTCNPEYSARQRLVVRAELVATLAKRPGVLPPALTGR